MKHTLWIEKRCQILKMDNYKCNICESTNRLEVHHVTYLGNRLAWHYPDHLLVTLCNKCHNKEHSNNATKNPDRISAWINRLSKIRYKSLI